MTISDLAAGAFGVLMLLAILFQLALAAGQPWGELAMGGRFPGRLPPAMRLAAIAQAVVLLLLGLVVLTRAELLLPRMYAASTRLIWVVVALSALSLVLNLITPSKWERIVWAPVALLMTLCSLAVAAA